MINITQRSQQPTLHKHERRRRTYSIMTSSYVLHIQVAAAPQNIDTNPTVTPNIPKVAAAPQNIDTSPTITHNHTWDLANWCVHTVIPSRGYILSRSTAAYRLRTTQVCVALIENGYGRRTVLSDRNVDPCATQPVSQNICRKKYRAW